MTILPKTAAEICEIIAERDRLRKACEKMGIALERSITALDDWIHIYAPEHCHAAKVKRSRERIQDEGGTLHYIAVVQQQNRNAIAQLEKSK